MMTIRKGKPPNKLGKVLESQKDLGLHHPTMTLRQMWGIALVLTILGFLILTFRSETSPLWQSILGWYLLGLNGAFLIVYYFDQYVPEKTDDSDRNKP